MAPQTPRPYDIFVGLKLRPPSPPLAEIPHTGTELDPLTIATACISFLVIGTVSRGLIRLPKASTRIPSRLRAMLPM